MMMRSFVMMIDNNNNNNKGLKTFESKIVVFTQASCAQSWEFFVFGNKVCLGRNLKIEFFVYIFFFF